MISTDREYYEDARHWDAQTYAPGGVEHLRFMATAAMIPSQAASMVDVGCGNGAFLSWVSRQRPDLRGIACERAGAARARRVCATPAVGGDILALPFDRAAVDVVAALEVIEHLPDGAHQQAIAELAGVARDWVLVSVPWCERLARIRCPDCSRAFNPYHHQRRYDRERMLDLVPEFRCVRLRTVRIPADVVSATAIRHVLKQTSWYRPSATVCPRCGWRASSDGGSGIGTNNGPTSALRSFLPVLKRTEWWIALYRRVGKAPCGS